MAGVPRSGGCTVLKDAKQTTAQVSSIFKSVPSFMLTNLPHVLGVIEHGSS